MNIIKIFMMKHDTSMIFVERGNFDFKYIFMSDNSLPLTR